MIQSNPFYAIISEGRNGRPTVKRVTQSWPSLEQDEKAIRLILEVPDAVLHYPAHMVEVPVEAQSVAAVAVEIEPPEDEQ